MNESCPPPHPPPPLPPVAHLPSPLEYYIGPLVLGYADVLHWYCDWLASEHQCV